VTRRNSSAGYAELVRGGTVPGSSAGAFRVRGVAMQAG